MMAITTAFHSGSREQKIGYQLPINWLPKSLFHGS